VTRRQSTYRPHYTCLQETTLIRPWGLAAAHRGLQLIRGRQADARCPHRVSPDPWDCSHGGLPLDADGVVRPSPGLGRSTGSIVPNRLPDHDPPAVVSPGPYRHQGPRQYLLPSAAPVLSLRLRLQLADIDLQGDPDGFLALTVVSPRRIAVVIERPELHGLESPLGAIAIARTKLEPNDSVARGFAALADFRLPEGVPPSSLLNWRRFQDAAGRLKPAMVYPQSGLPPAMNAFIEQIRKDLVHAIRRSCLLLRWRYSLGGPQDPLQPIDAGPEWSLDGSTWHPLPANTDVRLHAEPSVHPSASVTSEVQALLDTGQDEPLAHQVFHEAWRSRFSNRRSALVIAVAALEVSVKAFVGQMLPSAQWLIANQPSPPIRRLLAEYLPSLETPATIAGKVLAPPKAVLDLVDKAVGMRNRVAHAAGEDVGHDILEEMLIAIRDVLWMLDFYGGATWAVSHMSALTRTGLGLPDDDSAA